MALPSNVKFGTVTGRFMRVIGDGPDEDRNPDGVPLVGLKFRFEPSTKIFTNSASVPPVTILAEAVDATTDSEGFVIGSDGVRGINLVATNGEALEPKGWTWRVTVSGPTVATMAFSFMLPSDGTVDLTSVARVPSNPGEEIAQWEIVATNAVAAATRAEEAAQRAEAVGDTNDTITAGLINDPESETAAALSNLVIPAEASEQQYTLSAWDPQNPTVHPLNPKMTEVLLIGSSTMAQQSEHLADAFTNKVPSWGVTRVNMAQSGERAEQTLARTGLSPVRLTFPGGTIPATGAVTLDGNTPPTFGLKPFTGRVAGVLGTLERASQTQYKFTRKTGGTAVTVEAGVPFIPTLRTEGDTGGTAELPSLRDRIAFLDIGKNNLGDENAVAITNATLNVVYDWLVPRVKYVVLYGFFANTGQSAIAKEKLAAINAYRKDFAASREKIAYVDFQTYIMGSQVWEDTGITPTQDDRDKQAAGELAPSLSMDTQHLNATTHKAVIDRLVLSALGGLIGRSYSPAPAGPTIVASDGFSGAATVLNPARTSDNEYGGTARAWSATSHWSTNGAGALVTTTTGSGYLGWAYDIANQEITGQVKKLPTTNAVFLSARSASTQAATTNTSYRVVISTAGVRLQKRFNSADSDMTSNVTIVEGDWVGIRCVGSRISLIINGAVNTTVTDTDIATGAYVGVTKGAYGSDAEIDGVILRTGY